MDNFGERMKKRRLALGKSRAAVGAQLGVVGNTVYRWETGGRSPDQETLLKIAAALDTTISYLMGETEDPKPAPTRVQQKKPNPLGPDLKTNFISFDNWIPIPVLDIDTAASAGIDSGLSGVIPEASGFELIDPDDLGPVDDNHQPFGIRVEGDSMVGAGIPEKAIVVINPVVEVQNGTVALVVFDDLWAIKWVMRKKDGSVELHSANPNYSPILIAPEMASDDSWFKVVGPVMTILLRRQPKRMV